MNNNNNNELTKTERLILSLAVALGVSAIYAVFAYVVMFVFTALFGRVNMMVTQFVPAFIFYFFSVFFGDIEYNDTIDDKEK